MWNITKKQTLRSILTLIRQTVIASRLLVEGVCEFIEQRLIFSSKKFESILGTLKTAGRKTKGDGRKRSNGLGNGVPSGIFKGSFYFHLNNAFLGDVLVSLKMSRLVLLSPVRLSPLPTNPYCDHTCDNEVIDRSLRKIASRK